MKDQGIRHRQARGTRRIATLLDAAAQVFAEVGYDEATTNAIAARASMSPGSLYQFFPNKEAIAQALARRYEEQLRGLYDISLSVDLAALPLLEVVERIVDPLVAFNLAHPAFQALFVGSQISPTLAEASQELDDEVLSRVEAILAARVPAIPPAQRTLWASVSIRLFKALLPLAMTADARQSHQIVEEIKAVLYRYLDPLIG